MLPLTEAQIKITQHLYCHEEVKNWRLSDLALKKARIEFRSNTDEIEVYLKASLLNGLYSTFLYYSVSKMVERIIKTFNEKPHIDGYNLVLQLSDEPIDGRRRLSFASKYAHFFHPHRPPIFDRYAVFALAIHSGRSESYYNSGTDRYKRYYQDIADLKGAGKFDVDPHQLDRYLWLGGMWVDFKERGNTKINQEALRLFQSQHLDCVDAFGKLAGVYHASLES